MVTAILHSITYTVQANTLSGDCADDLFIGHTKNLVSSRLDLNLSVLYMCAYPTLEWEKQCSLFMFIVKARKAAQDVPGGEPKCLPSSERFSVQVSLGTLPSLSDCTATVPPNPPNSKGICFHF